MTDNYYTAMECNKQVFGQFTAVTHLSIKDRKAERQEKGKVKA